MFHHRSLLRTATTLLALAALAGASFGAGFVPRACLLPFSAAESKSPSECAHARPCCCGAKVQPRACGCRWEDDQPAPPTPPPDDSGRALKWAPHLDALAALPAAVAAERAAPSPSSKFFSLCGRSVQSLLCVWRI